MSKLCGKCKTLKVETDFNSSQFSKSGGWCKLCCQTYRRLHYENNKELYKNNCATYYQDNKKEIDERNNEYKNNHQSDIISYQKEYRETHKEELKTLNREYQKLRRQTDTLFVLRKRISNSVNVSLKNNGHPKVGSILKFLPYSIKELKEHLESQFESWMNWNNWGIYYKDFWNDNDSSTWTWQIDHIVPHSTFKYTSMEDDNFKKCWSLENLRPYSSKQNLLDGNRK